MAKKTSDDVASFFGTELDALINITISSASKTGNKEVLDSVMSDCCAVVDTIVDMIVALSNPDPNNNPQPKPSSTDECHREISIDELIFESYTFGKSNAEKINSHKRDISGVIQKYAWFLVTLGAQLKEDEYVQKNVRSTR